MMRSRVDAGWLCCVCLAVMGVGCAPSAAERRGAAKTAISLLQEGKFEEAGKEAGGVIGKDGANPEARAVAALVRYKKAMHQFSADVRTLPMMLFSGTSNHRYFRFSLETTSKELAVVEEDLSVASAEPEFDLELCLACWKVDWNQNGRIDNGDERLFEIENDGEGSSLPDGDPRRRPTFHFDRGDLFWARAMLSFQRAVLELLQAYRWDEVDQLRAVIAGSVQTVTIRLGSKERVARAKDLLLEGLAHADRTRREYLAETDDDREWLPNPRQKSHPMPLPVDDALYQTWEQVTGDLSRLLSSQEGVSVAAAAQLGDHQWTQPPNGFIDIGRLFSEPGDIEIPIETLTHSHFGHDQPDGAAESEKLLQSIFGKSYVEKMAPTPLLGRFERMKNEVQQGHESFEHKLRYLFWLN